MTVLSFAEDVASIARIANSAGRIERVGAETARAIAAGDTDALLSLHSLDIAATDPAAAKLLGVSAPHADVPPMDIVRGDIPLISGLNSPLTVGRADSVELAGSEILSRRVFATPMATPDEMQVRYAAHTLPSFVSSRGVPTVVSRTFDSGDDLGQVYTARQHQVVGVYRLNTRPGEPNAAASGITISPDGKVLASRHPLMDRARGDIWVRFLERRVTPHTFKYNIIDEDKATDLVTLKPNSPLPARGPIPFAPESDFLHEVKNGTKIATFGAQNLTGGPGSVRGDFFLSEGKVLATHTVRFGREPAQLMVQTDSVADYGLSGGATFVVKKGMWLRSPDDGKIAGFLIGGGYDNARAEAVSGRLMAGFGTNDYRSYLTPAVRAIPMIRRNFYR